MSTTYYVYDKRGRNAFIHTNAHTAAGIIRAAMEALDVSEGDYLYYTPDEVVAGIMDALQVNRRRAVLYYAVALEGIEVYQCDYIRSSGAYKRGPVSLTLDLEANEVF